MSADTYGKLSDNPASIEAGAKRIWDSENGNNPQMTWARQETLTQRFYRLLAASVLRAAESATTSTNSIPAPMATTNEKPRV